MKKLLLNCDQVFDVLTRGPFPTGDPTDDAVEHHLRACHDCRSLAEALRPAVAVLHEAVSAEQALDLPEYQGSLPWERPVIRKLSMARLAGPPRGERARPRQAFPVRRSSQAGGNSVRLIAATLLVVGLSAWLWALVSDRMNHGHIARKPVAPQEMWSPAREGVPGASGLVALANLRLPSDCLPVSHRPLSQDQAAELAMALYDGSLAGVQCCTQCHHAGQSAARGVAATAVARVAQEHCQVCHRS